MRLETLKVKNFRGYVQSSEIGFEDLTTIIGKNDIGKSTLLEALAIFLEEGSIKPELADLNVDVDENFYEVTCSFSGFPDELVIDVDASTSLASEYLLDQDQNLRVTKRWTCGSTAKPKEEIFISCLHPSNPELSDLLTLKDTELRARVKTKLEPDEAALVNKSAKPAMRQALWSSEELVLEETLVPVSKEASKTIWEKLSLHLPHFALFQSDRSSKDSDSEVQNPMKLAIESALADDALNASLNDIVEKVRERATELAERTHGVLEKLDPDIANGLVPEFKSDPKWASLFNMTLIGDNGISINKRGSGVRRLVLVSFFRAEAERMVEEGTKQNIIYAIEEPETSQHPHYQRMLLDSFKRMAEVEGSQVLLTTHSPGVALNLPTSGLRFVTRDEFGAPDVLSGNKEAWAQIVEELGIVADNRVRVLVCVEGPHDVSALTAFSKTLNADEPDEYLDFESDFRVAFIPQGGGALKHWVAQRYLKDLELPEFHLYDRDEDNKYQDVVTSVNGRGDGSFATLTTRREMENYVHESAIIDVFGVKVDVDDHGSIIKAVSDATKESDSVRPSSVGTVKIKINNDCFSAMTVAQIDEIDEQGEIRGWIRKITQMALKA